MTPDTPTPPPAAPVTGQPLTVSQLQFFIGLIISTAVIVATLLKGVYDIKETMYAQIATVTQHNAVQDTRRESDRKDIDRLQFDVADLRRNKQDKPFKLNASL